MDGLVDACNVPCVYKSFGCERYVAYHLVADHRSRCVHAPCYCYECTPPSLVHHLTPSFGKHSWPATNIKYKTCYLFAVPEALEDHHRLLVTEEDGIVFLLAVGTGKGRAGRRPVFVVYVRGNTADADTRPLYKCVLSVDAPPAYDGDLGGSLTLNETVVRYSVPVKVDIEQGWLHVFVNPKIMHGVSNEVHLVICITKLTVHH